MVIKVGDRFFNPKSGEEYLIVTVGEYFVLWKALFRGEWIPVMHPIRIEEIERDVRNRVILPDTPANRVLFSR